jgi:hypothetical protein
VVADRLHIPFGDADYESVCEHTKPSGIAAREAAITSRDLHEINRSQLRSQVVLILN